jgi:hypothetical protein
MLDPLSIRRLGAQAVLIGLADLSEAVWRKRLRAGNDWLLWLLSVFVAAPEPPGPAVPRPAGRLLLVDTSCLRQPGEQGTIGDGLWPRLPGGADAPSTDDRPSGWGTPQLLLWQAGNVLVVNSGDGYCRSVT